MIELTTPPQHDSEPIHKPSPSPSHPPIAPFQPHIYLPSTSSSPSSNLLIILPGLGDHPQSYSSLASSLQNTLPQTAILILRPPTPIPLLADPDEHPSQSPHAWWDAFDLLTGDTLPPQAQNPRSCLDQLSKLLDYLTAPLSSNGCAWPSHTIHLFGYGQGGTAALESAIAWTRSQRISSSPARDTHELGSVVSVCGPMLSQPGSLSTPRPASIPILSFLRHPSADNSAPQAITERNKLKTAFQPSPQVVVLPGNEDTMLRGKSEFDILIKFWSEQAKWRNRSQWELGQQEGVYRVA
ncbi:hypothetical protein CF319_g4079 [Tilletia indica]|nr:hypothetical protein CF319_g4079 [Tilletia indica]